MNFRSKWQTQLLDSLVYLVNPSKMSAFMRCSDGMALALLESKSHVLSISCREVMMRDVCESSQEPSSGRHWSTSQLKAFSRAKLASDKDTFERTQTERLEIKNLSRVKMWLICFFHLLRFILKIF